MLLDYIKQIIAVGFLLLVLLGLCVILGCGVVDTQDTSMGAFREYEYQVRAYNNYVDFIDWGVKRLQNADPEDLSMSPEDWHRYMISKANYKLSKGLFR